MLKVHIYLHFTAIPAFAHAFLKEICVLCKTFCILMLFMHICDVQSSQTVVCDIIFLFMATACDAKSPDFTVKQILPPKFYSQFIHLMKLKIKVENCENNQISLSKSELFLTSSC